MLFSFQADEEFVIRQITSGTLTRIATSQDASASAHYCRTLCNLLMALSIAETKALALVDHVTLGSTRWFAKCDTVEVPSRHVSSYDPR
jgi:hypothetical protein